MKETTDHIQVHNHSFNHFINRSIKVLIRKFTSSCSHMLKRRLLQVQRSTRFTKVKQTSLTRAIPHKSEIHYNSDIKKSTNTLHIEKTLRIYSEPHPHKPHIQIDHTWCSRTNWSVKTWTWSLLDPAFGENYMKLTQHLKILKQDQDLSKKIKTSPRHNIIP